jgi:hypothetical protein
MWPFKKKPVVVVTVPATPTPTPVAVVANPIVINPTDVEKVENIQYRIGAIKRWIEQTVEEGKTIAEDRMAALEAETAMLKGKLLLEFGIK